MKKILLVIAFLFAGFIIFISYSKTAFHKSHPFLSEQEVKKSDSVLGKAFSDHLSSFKISGQGVVVKVLPDDISGTRHQRFIVELASGQTLLIAHNIDIANRVGSLRESDTVRFSGEYEWNDQGGVIHNTHRDPKGRHAAGWLEYKGKRYE